MTPSSLFKKIPIIYFFIFLLLVSFIACKKQTIKKEDITIIKVTDSDLYDILFLDKERGYAVGGKLFSETAILATNDGGINWHKVQVNLDMDRAVFSITKVDNELMAVGIDGKTYLNNGIGLSNWMALQTYRWHWYKAIAFSSDYRGIIVGGRAQSYGEFHFVDVWGNAYGERLFDFELTDVIFNQKDVGFISGYGTLLRSTDTGLTWDTLSLKGDFFKALYYNEQTATLWTVGYNGSIFKSMDNGDSWRSIRNGNNPLFNGYAFTNIYFIDDKIGYIIGEKGCILQTKDGGEHWQPIQTFTDEDLHSIYHNPPYIFICGKNGFLAKIKY